MYGPFLQSLEPSHRRGSEARQEYLTHQTVILGVQGHHLNIATHVFQRVIFAIIASKMGSVEMPRHLNALHIIGEW